MPQPVTTQHVPRSSRRILLPLLAAACFLSPALSVRAQQSSVAPESSVQEPVASAADQLAPGQLAASLPESPDAVTSNVQPSGAALGFSSSLLPESPIADQDPAARPSLPRMAGPSDKYIAPGQPVPKLSGGDKFVLGVRDAVSFFSFTAWVVDAGYEQLVDASPNYGHNSVAFGKRFGAGVARDISQGVLGDSILAPLFHEDPRYYKMGPGHSTIARIVYAGSRALITRTDGGRTSPNFSQVLGNLGGAILTETYYPQVNRGFTQVTETFAGSVGGSALGFVVSEFLSDVLVSLHFQHPK